MKNFILALLLFAMAGCDIPLDQDEVFTEKARTAQITVVSTDPCPWCDKQMDVLERMKKNGDLKGVTVKKTYDTSTWPASSFPTLYIRTDSGEAKYVGYQTARAISKALEH
jgi:hypothetical protein